MPAPGPVLLFSADLAGTGVARNTVNLANALARRRVETEVVALAGGALAGDLQGVRLTLLGRPRAPRALALTAGTPELRRRIAALRPSTVVSMGNHAHLAVWAAMRGLTGPALVYRISNEVAHPGERAISRILRRAGLRLIAADADRIACVSGRLAALPDLADARQAGRVETTPNGVDLAAVRRRAMEPSPHPWIADGRPFLVSVGRVHPQKNYDTLIEALAAARAAGADLRLVILGGGPAARMAGLRARADALGLQEALRLEGEVANPFPLLAAASAFALPSWWEGASNSLLEAMACGTPVAASRTAGDAAQVLDGGRYGRLVDPGDARGLARALVEQSAPGPARIMPGARAEAFGLEAAVDRLAGIVLATRRRSADATPASGSLPDAART